MRSTTLFSVLLAITRKFVMLSTIQEPHVPSSVTAAIPIKPVFLPIEDDLDGETDEAIISQAKQNEKAVQDAADIGEHIACRYTHCLKSPLPYLYS